MKRYTATVATLALAAAVRLTHAGAVFRDQIASAGNDAWYYRDRVLDLRAGTAHIGDGAGDALYQWVALAWTRLLDPVAGPDAALALLPVALGVATVAAVGGLAALVSDDRRVPLLAMAIFATHPGHALRSGVGYADHHALDYLLLALALAALVVGVRADDWQRRALGVAGIAGSLGAAMLAWDGAPVLLVPVVTATAALVWSQKTVPWDIVTAVCLGLGGATVVAAGPHLALDWQPALVVVAPALAAVAVAVVAATASSRRASVAGIGVGVTSVAAVAVVAPALAARFVERVSQDLLGRPGIIEAAPIVHPRALATGAPLWFLGVLVLFAPAIALVGWRLRVEPAWATVGGATAGLAALTAVQLRFAGELSVPLAVLAPVTLVALASEVGDAPALGCDGWSRGLVTVAGFVCLAGVVVSVAAGGGLVIDDQRYAAAEYIDDHGGGEVLATWGEARTYNALVNGESRSYAFAREHYAAVVRDEQEVPDSVDWVVVTAPETPRYDADWHAGEAELVWERGPVRVYNVHE